MPIRFALRAMLDYDDGEDLLLHYVMMSCFTFDGVSRGKCAY